MGDHKCLMRAPGGAEPSRPTLGHYAAARFRSRSSRSRYSDFHGFAVKTVCFVKVLKTLISLKIGSKLKIASQLFFSVELRPSTDRKTTREVVSETHFSPEKFDS